MANEKRLIDVDAFRDHWNKNYRHQYANDTFLFALANFPTVDAVPVDDMKEFAEDVAYQFGFYVHKDERLCITHGGLSTLEWAFDILGWDNPHPIPESECEVEGCHEHATCGIPTADGYKRMCGKHCREHLAKMDGDGNG